MEVKVIKNIEIVSIDDKNDRKLYEYLPWWVESINKEKKMLQTTEESLLSELLVATFAVSSETGDVVAAAGIVNARNKHNTEIVWNNKKVIEIGSNFVSPDFRNQGIGRRLVERRLELCKERGWIPVSVTTNPAMLRIFSKFNAVPMDGIEEYKKLREDLCLCAVVSCDCSFCPLHPQAGWIFL